MSPARPLNSQAINTTKNEGTLKTLDLRTPEQWRKWLAGHHDSEAEVWLIFYKHHTGRASIAYKDALDEALCFGWVDSLIKRLDDARYARKFTPRKPDSKWSTVNRKRYAQLQASGRLMPAGLKRAPTHRHYDTTRRSFTRVPRFMQEALQARPKAWNFFKSLAPSYRRMYIGWIDSAKREETKLRRLREARRLLAAGKKLGLK